MKSIKNLSTLDMFILLAASVMFLGIFLFIRAAVSICAIIIILSYLFHTKFTFSGIRESRALTFLILAGILINIAMFYAMFVNHTFYAKDLFGFANPLLVVLYIYALVYFLSKNRKYSDYLLNLFISIVCVLALISLITYIYKNIHGQEFIISDLYLHFSGGSIIQSVVALTFPLVGVMLIIRALRKKHIATKLILFSLAIVVIFADLFINRSKVGYLIEFFVLVYYSFVLIRKYSYVHGSINYKKMIMMLVLCPLSLFIIFGITYKYSEIFNTRVTAMFSETDSFFSKKDDQNLYLQSTGQRWAYYYSSVKTFKEYPSVFLFGCVYDEGVLNVKDCTKLLIDNSPTLTANARVVGDGIMAHNEFMNYIFRGGVLAGLFLIAFFISLFYEARKYDKNDRSCLRILTVAFFIGCSFDYFITVQMDVITLSTLLAILLSRYPEKDKLNLTK